MRRQKRWFRRTARSLTSLVLVGTVWACGGNGATGPDVPTLEDLVGSWTIEVWEYSLATDRSQKVDWVITKGLGGQLVVGQDGSFTVSPALDAGWGVDSGTLTVQADSIYWNGENDEEWVAFDLDTALTVFWPETSFVDADQDGRPEEAWLRVVFRRA